MKDPIIPKLPSRLAYWIDLKRNETGRGQALRAAKAWQYPSETWQNRPQADFINIHDTGFLVSWPFPPIPLCGSILLPCLAELSTLSSREQDKPREYIAPARLGSGYYVLCSPFIYARGAWSSPNFTLWMLIEHWLWQNPKKNPFLTHSSILVV